jgi:hypothetical protein
MRTVSTITVTSPIGTRASNTTSGIALRISAIPVRFWNRFTPITVYTTRPIKVPTATQAQPRRL